MPGVALQVILIILLILANGVFALAEIAVVSARRARLQQRADDGDAGAQAALALAREPGRFLSTVQVGITLIGILAGAFGGATLAQPLAALIANIDVLAPYANALAFGLVVVLISYLSLVLGELLPKRLALNNPERVAALVARPMQLLSRLASPLVRILTASTDALMAMLGVRSSAEPPITAEEIGILLEQGRTAGVFEASEQDIVESALNLDERRISTLMTPRHEIEWLDLDETVGAIRDKVLASQHRYFPAAHGDLDDVLGILRGRDLLAALVLGQPINWAALVREPLFVPESQSILDVMHALKESGQPMALVIDEFGGVQGLVTQTDLLEVLVGDFPSAGAPAEAEAVRRPDGSWLLDGQLPLWEFKELLQLRSLPEDAESGLDTLGGLVMAMLQRIPSKGESFEMDGWRFEVVDMDGRRVDQVLAAPLQNAQANKNAE